MLNGEWVQLEGPLTVQDLLKSRGYRLEMKIAVAINGHFLPRHAYTTHLIADADDIEVVSPMQGG